MNTMIQTSSDNKMLTKREAGKLYYTTKKELYRRLSRSKFISKFRSKGWECQLPYLLEIYEIYCDDFKFRYYLNDYLLLNNTSTNLFRESLKELDKKPWILKLGISGEVGMGKSRLGRKLARLIARAYNKNIRFRMDPLDPNEFREFILFKEDNQDHDFLDVFVCYQYDQATNLSKRSDIPNSVIFLDETPELQGQGSVKVKKQLRNILRVSARANKLNFMYINPEDIKIKTNWHLRILGINFEKQQTLVMLYIYSKEKSRLIAEGCAILDVSEDPNITEYYEKTSLRIKRKLLE